ncbi:SpoIIE family protein phosphatase [Pseudonocardia xishanensis]|uniref:histidine kinase n=1 Tax=Pseudonocardia xishanensis TaxID=630995 RepID=A0ABP8RLW3_9PSEU
MSAPPEDPGSLFAHGGEVGAVMGERDWAATPVGDPETWPAALRSVVRILLGSRFSMWMGWGPDLVVFYNDAYQRDTLRTKHPWALGRPAREVWAEIWPDIGPRIESVLETGEATWDSDLLLFLERSGYPEETYHTFSYSPLADETGATAGFLCVVTENTDRVLSERRMDTLRALSAALTSTRSEREVLDAVGDQLGRRTRDLPFTAVYLTADGGAARLACAVGVEEGSAAAPHTLAADHPWHRPEVLDGHPVVVDGLSALLPDLPTGSWDRPPEQAIVLPLGSAQEGAVAGFLVAGLNPYRALDDGYRGFVELLGAQIASGLRSARAYETERTRAEALAELDRAKTDFFSNVSHEFRTPLTLIMGPLEDLRREADPGPVDPARLRTELDVVHRNGMRLGKLVNSLLDYSRLQAGRIDARFGPVDLARLTNELAGAFRSAVEHAELGFVVDCPPLTAPVHVDRDSWEKIVLNLLSNALKFTFDGEIRVVLREVAGAVRLTVSDTGVGVAESEMPRLFERFHRVTGVRSRSAEGSGIGLAMVRELVGLHGGRITAQSTPGVGTTFTVEVPTGTAHLPADRIVDAADIEADAPEPRLAAPFVAESLRWLPATGPGPGEPAAGEAQFSRVLVADDNADMRDYLRRLLADRYTVEAVPDGRSALDSALADPPDILVTDVMMPGIDGLELLARLRADPRTARVPVLLLSARAGQEAAVEGLVAGADDYLVKPFAAPELLARVDGTLRLSRARTEAEQRFRMLADATPALIWVDGPEGDRTFVNQAWRDYTGAMDLAGWRSLVHPDDLEHYDARRAAATRENAGFEVEYRLRRADGRYLWVLDRGVPVAGPGAAGGGYVGGCLDIDARYREEERQRVVGEVGAAMDRAAAVHERREVLVRSLVDEGVADLAGLVVTDGTGPEVVAVATRDEETRELLRQVDVGPRWFADVVTKGLPVVLPGDGGLLSEGPPVQQDLGRRLALRSVALVPLAARGRIAGVLAAARTAPAAPQDDDDLALLDEIGARAAVALDNAQLFASEQETTARLALLQQATAALSAAPTPTLVAQVATEQFAQLTGATAVGVWELRADGVLEALALRGWDPRVERDWNTLPTDSDDPTAEAVRSRKPMWVERDEDWRTRYPQIDELVRREYGYGAVSSVPLVVAGRCIGVVSIAFVAERVLTDTERAAVLSLAEQCAEALRRAELLAAESDARLAAEKFSMVVSALSRAVTPAEVGRVILDHAVDIGAEEAAVVLVRDGQLEILASSEAVDVHRVPLAAGHPLAHASRTGRPVWVGERSEQAWRHRRLRTGQIELPDQVAVPLDLGGTILGALGLRFPAAPGTSGVAPPLSDEARAALLTVAAQCAQALDRARLHEAEHEIAAVLQRSLLPREVVPLEGLAVAARYRPGAAGVQAGGDWYDLFPVSLAGGRAGIALAVGDVVGQGAAAAAVMGQLRVALSGALRQGRAPAEALETLDEYVSWVPGAQASTAACLILDRETRTLRWARAGHLPPLLVDSTGAGFLEGGHGPVLGIRGRPPYSEGTIVVRPGATLLLYTDGLVERRGELLDTGLERLRTAAEDLADAPPEQLVDGLLDRLGEQDVHPDDIAVVAVRLLPAPLVTTVPAEAGELRGLRRRIAEWARLAALDELLVEDLQLVLGEAAANVVDHAYPDAPGSYDLRVALRGDGAVHVVVTDHGTWRPAPADKGHRGRGLDLIRALGREVTVQPGPLGTVIGFVVAPESAGAVPPPAPSTGLAPLVPDLRVHREDGTVRVGIRGEVDLATVGGLGAELLRLVDGASRGEEVRLDLDDVGYLASAGVGMLVDLVRQAAERGVRIRLDARPGTPAARVLDLTGIEPPAS